MVPFRLICVAAWVAPLVVLWGSYDASNVPKAAFVHVLVAAAFLAWVLKPEAVEPPDGPSGRSPFEVPLLGLLLWSGLSLTWAHDGQAGFHPWLQWAMAGVAYLVLRLVAPKPALLGRLFLGVFAAAVAVAAIGLAQAAFDVRWVPQAFPPASTFANKNLAAGFAAAAWPLGLVAFTEARRWRMAAWMAGATVILMYVVVSLSRGAWIAVTVQLLVAVVAALVVRRRLLPKAGHTAVAAVVLMLLIGGGALAAMGKGAVAWRHLAGLWEGAQASSQTPSASAVSVRGRMAIWRNTLEMVNDRARRGVGLGNHAVWYPRYANAVVPDPLHSTSTRQADFVHNDYLQAAAELGLPGLALVMWLVVAVAMTAWRALTAVPEGQGPLSMAVVLSLVGLGVDALVSFPFQLAYPPLLFAVLLAALRALAAPSSKTARGDGARVMAPPWMAWASLLLVAGLALHHVQRLRTDRHLFRMFRAERQNDWPAAEKEAQAALETDGKAVDPLFVLGQTAFVTGRAGETVVWFEKLLARRPYYGNALRNLASVYGTSGLNDKAEACYRRIVEIDPRDALSHYKLGMLQQQRGALDEARRSLSRAAELEPANAAYPFRLGVAAMQAGDAAEAEVALKRALERAPDNAEYHKVMGVLLSQSGGRSAEAAPHLERALQLNPAIADAARMRQMVAQIGAARR